MTIIRSKLLSSPAQGAADSPGERLNILMTDIARKGF